MDADHVYQQVLAENAKLKQEVQDLKAQCEVRPSMIHIQNNNAWSDPKQLEEMRESVYSKIGQLQLEAAKLEELCHEVLPLDTSAEASVDKKDCPTPAKVTKSLNEAAQASRSFNLKCPKGTKDQDPADMVVKEQLFSIITTSFKLFGGVPLQTPTFELKEILTGKYGEDSKLIYDLADQGKEELSLRYDLTVPFARYVAMNKLQVISRYQIGLVYRRDHPAMNRGRYREFYQCDYDIAGEYDLMIPDSQCIALVDDVLTKLDVGNFIIKVNHRKLLEGLFVTCGVPMNKFNSICSAVDKLDKMSWEDVKKEMTVEKGLDVAVADRLGLYVLRSGGLELLTNLLEDEALKSNDMAVNGIKELIVLSKHCDLNNCSKNIQFDLGLARGLDYYTGVIYEAVVIASQHNPSSTTIAANNVAPKSKSAEKKEEKKKRKNKSKVTEDDNEEDEGELGVGVGSVAGGGRYDNLVGMFNSDGSKVPCVGVSFGIERLFSILKKKHLDSGQKIKTLPTQVFVISAHKGLLDEKTRVCADLRKGNIQANFIFKSDPKMLTQIQYCEKNQIPLAVILGEAELNKGMVKLRNVNTRGEWEVARGDLVAEINKFFVTTSTKQSKE